ncbi:MAG: sigma-70 family RNA polymerase sigma factor [Acidobacteria bacterium]|nr:sigma-70 family RNA polymerase sigma factor [Acidobacteriota bacterium]MBI3656353.1 sigma-70 family RNA polymerase sigma factor [Acidobacteriota bacterium]
MESTALTLNWMVLTDDELIHSFVEGNQEAFRGLVSKYKDPITHYIHVMIRDYECAVDLAQETFLRVYKHADAYKTTYQFSTWIYRIATNLAIDEIRRRRRQMTQPLENRRHSSGTAFPTESYIIDTRGLRPDEALIQKEKLRYLSNAIESLPRKYRHVFVLKEIQDLPYEEIADVLSCSSGTVKSRLHRARGLLRKKLAHYLNRGKV